MEGIAGEKLLTGREMVTGKKIPSGKRRKGMGGGNQKHRFQISFPGVGALRECLADRQGSPEGPPKEKGGLGPHEGKEFT